MKQYLLGLAILLSLWVTAQDSKVKISTSKGDSNLTFTGTRGIERDDNYDSSGHFIIGGYVSTYFASYSDTSGSNGYQKFPTVAPRDEAFGLNMVMLSMKYRSERLRANSIFQFGDIPQAAWSPSLHNIQEANMGFRIVKKLWFDAGFFRTHIGLESIQPRENMTMSIAVPTFFEPYYMSGAKLTYTGFEKLTIQVNAFNGFNGFIETNDTKAYGANLVYDFTPNFNITYSFITSDESRRGDGTQQRFYNNLISTFRSNTWTFGFEFNYGTQLNSGLSDPTKTAEVYSGLLAANYRFNHYFSVYSRLAYFQDRDEMLTGPIENQNHELVGLDILGTTAGIEYNPILNSYVRLEGRLLQTDKNETVFYPLQGDAHQRLELNIGMGVWF